jgi:CubicO group peptidase (beta-lactamase class C family)
MKSLTYLINSLSRLEPGFAAVMLKDNQIVWRKCVGLADLNKKIPITPITNFRLASLSKQFTAMTVMILVQRRKLNLEDKLTDFFSDYPAYGNQVTVRQLLSHTAGIPDHEKPLYKLMNLFQKSLRASPSDGRSAAISSLDLDCHVANAPRNDRGNSEPTIYEALEVLKNQPTPLFPPGSRYLYSDAGYVLLALIIEKVSGLSYRDFLKQNIFSPLKMVDSDVMDQTKPLVKNRALGYRTRKKIATSSRRHVGTPRNDNETFEELDYDPLNYIVGDEGVYSSIEDMAKWSQAWDEEILVSRKSLTEAMAPELLTNGKFGRAGFSWLIGKNLNRFRLKDGMTRAVYQDGSWVGFRNIILKIPTKKLTVIILSNRADLDTERQRISTAFFAAQKFF